MRFFRWLWYHWRTLLAAGGVLGALALLWYVHDTPAQPTAVLRVDALSAFFIFATLAGVALAVLVGSEGRSLPDAPVVTASVVRAPTEGPPTADTPVVVASVVVASVVRAPTEGPPYRLVVGIGVLVVAYVTTLVPVIVGAYMILALLTLPPRPHSPATLSLDWRRFLHSLGKALRYVVTAAPGLLAATCLLIGYGTLALRGALRYDDRLAGVALDSFVFWFVLLAAVLNAQFSMLNSQFPSHVNDLLRIAWLYPLVRLYSLGPWNDGWSFATLLLGGAAALWSATSALTHPHEPARSARIIVSYLGLTLAGLGLGTSAGIAAGCYGMLAYLVLIRRSATGGQPDTLEPGQPRAADDQDLGNDGWTTAMSWLVSGAVPLTAPFVAAWMLVGAAAAGGVTLLAGVAWLVTLLNALTTAMSHAPRPAARQSLAVGAALSVVLGVGSAPLVRWLIAPVVAQLQGGLTPYGDINVWPWVGLAASDSAHRQVTSLPSIAVAALMLVLSALVYLVARLRDIRAVAPQAAGVVEAVRPATQPDPETLLRHLLAEVPWLGGAPGPAPDGEEQRGDGE